VDFVARSSQDYHGFAIANTDIILELFHNQVARARYTFTQPGEYLFVCSAYCGAGHATMTGKVIVE
jgi:cytochrome c oxidase subunit 2